MLKFKEMFNIAMSILSGWDFKTLEDILNSFDIVATDKVDRASTDGKKLYINPKYFEDLFRKISEKYGEEMTEKFCVSALVGSILHEALHKLLRHIEGMEIVENKYAYNLAADAVVNEIVDILLEIAGLVKRRDIPFFKAVYKENLEKWLGIKIEEKDITEDIYNKIKDKVTGGPTLNISGLGRYNPDILPKGTEIEGETIRVGIKKGKLDPGRRREILRKFLNFIKKRAGNVPGELEELVKVVDNNRMKILKDVRETVERYNRKERTWDRVNRRDGSYLARISENLTMKGDKEKILPTMVFGIDVSGSMKVKEVGYLLGLIRKYLGKVIIVQWDKEVQKVDEFKSGRKIPRNYKIIGRGGTGMVSFLEYLKKLEKGTKYVVIAASDLILSDENEARELLDEILKLRYIMEMIIIGTKKDPEEVFPIKHRKLRKYYIPVIDWLEDVI